MTLPTPDRGWEEIGDQVLEHGLTTVVVNLGVAVLFLQGIVFIRGMVCFWTSDHRKWLWGREDSRELHIAILKSSSLLSVSLLCLQNNLCENSSICLWNTDILPCCILDFRPTPSRQTPSPVNSRSCLNLQSPHIGCHCCLNKSLKRL